MDPGRPGPPADIPAPPPEAAIAGPPEVEPPHWTLWWVYLFLRPEAFFRHFVLRPKPFLTAFLAWLYGISGVMDRLEFRMSIGQEDAGYVLLLSDWRYYWAAVAGLGVLGAALYYAVGGWWYRLRIRWSGAGATDARLARRVYIYASQAYDFPVIVYTLWLTARYPSPAAASEADIIGVILGILALFYSIYVSYRGVRTVFPVRRWPARVWFLILPSLFYLMFVALLLLVAMAASWVLEPPPAVDAPAKLEGPDFSVLYPSNWTVEAEETQDGSSRTFTIEPEVADALVALTFHEGTFDSDDCTLEKFHDLYASYELRKVRSMGSWGAYDGSGFAGSLVHEGKTFAFTHFCRTHGDPPFEVLELVEADARERLEPGFRLIRETFRLQPPS